MYTEIIVEETREELIQYPYKNWHHIILHTVLNKTLYGYIPIHWHSALQYVYIINGELKVGIGEELIHIPKGHGLFINSQVVHEINESVSDTEYFCWNIDLADMYKQIEMEYLTQVLELAHKIPYIYLSPNLSEHQMLINIIKEAGDKFDKKEQHFKLDISICYYESLKHLINIMSQIETDAHYYFDQRIKTLIKYIQDHYQSKITLNDLSENIHMSKSETVRLFSKYVHQTPFQYILNYRLEKSVSMLNKHTDKSITDISYACGFSTTSYFIQKFKERYGQTPKQFLKQIKK
ncbi:AraC family transcriptional regulator [Mammaliicoccus sciuri]|uniref:AraC family transcriptional regulator n=1 Tax=Mammaliicoccus sciuri TaxID=1296 RepID=UPI0021D3913E|nr:AraC family transcriptional regulator [Mammaliicoccus sciuri]UXV28426.1 AraC family transcriptional regulator [Mammaliicoccus sciuri]